MAKFSQMLIKARSTDLPRWRKLFWGVLLAMLIANFFIHPHHAEYVLDAYLGFWPLFGLVVTLLMVLVMKKVVQPLIDRSEDGNDD
jgi:uncharacterized membrane protein HdeD (DUF308 family)